MFIDFVMPKRSLFTALGAIELLSWGNLAVFYGESELCPDLLLELMLLVSSHGDVTIWP